MPRSSSMKTIRRSSTLRSARPEDALNSGNSRLGTSGPNGRLPIALNPRVREASVELLNQLLADTMTLRDLYKKHHWQVAGPAFYALHLLFDKHYEQQDKLVDEIGERIRILGGISVVMGADVAEITKIPRPPMGREPTEKQIQRLLDAHEIILLGGHASARQADDAGDDGTNDLIVSSIIRTNELQSWFVGEHLDHLPSSDH